MTSIPSACVAAPNFRSVTPPAHRVLSTPELLSIVLNFSDRNSNARNARVCKRWSDIALDLVWKEINSVFHLFYPLRTENFRSTGGKYTFETLPEADDWSRYRKYASRVRSLKTRMYFSDHRPPANIPKLNTLLDNVAKSRTSLEILPNLHTLEWVVTPACIEHCKLFLHPGLRYLSITALPLQDSRPYFYTDLCAHAPNLNTLSLFVPSPGDKTILAELRVLLQNLPGLKKIVLPEFHYTSAVVEELSQAKNIEIMDSSRNLGFGVQKNIASFSPALKEGTFPCLRELNLTATINNLDRFFQSRFVPTHLTTLHIQSYTSAASEDVHTFLNTLSKCCQRISELALLLCHKECSSELSEDQLSYDTIKPVLSFPNLSSFELLHKYPLRISLDELEDLASRWPHLENLVLNPAPLFLDKSTCTLDLRALLPFARHCPRLHLLGLYMNATLAENPSLRGSFKPFRILRVLLVGASQVQDVNTTAIFLSRILSPLCTLETGCTWVELGPEYKFFLPHKLAGELDRGRKSWRGVQHLLPTLIQLRREEEKERRDVLRDVENLNVQLRKEVEDLRLRIACCQW